MKPVRGTSPLAAAALVTLAVAGSAAARPSIIADPNPVHRGHLLGVHGVASGCPRGDEVTLISRAFSPRHEFAGVPAIFARVRPAGRYSVRTRIPAARKPGRYTITGRCGGGNLGIALTLRVLA